MPNNKEREFKGIWIPRGIYLSRECCWTAKILFVEIDSFTKNEKECFFSNEYLADFLGVSVRQVQIHIKKLKEIGWIEQTGFDGRKRYLKSCFSYRKNEGAKQTSGEGRNKLHPGDELNFTHTNTYTNTINNNGHSDEYTGAFNTFWEKYPRKVNKKGSFRCWKTLLKKGFKPEKILLCTENYAKIKAGTEKKYMMHPSTFLGPDQRFLDYEKQIFDSTGPQYCEECGAMLIDGRCPNCGTDVQ